MAIILISRLPSECNWNYATQDCDCTDIVDCYAIFTTGLTVGFCNLFCGYVIYYIYSYIYLQLFPCEYVICNLYTRDNITYNRVCLGFALILV